MNQPFGGCQYLLTQCPRLIAAISRSDHVACSSLHEETGWSEWFGVLFFFSLLWSQRLVARAVHTMRLAAKTV